MSYPTGMEVLQSFQNVPQIKRHLLFSQVSPTHDVVQETTLICPAEQKTKRYKQVAQRIFMEIKVAKLYTESPRTL